MNYEEKTLSKKNVYEGNIIGVDELKVLQPDGKEASRELVKHNGGSAVIPISDDGEIYIVRQYRKPIETESLEIPAGKLDKGENPLICAHRELKEETGLETKNMKHLIDLHCAPGFCNEKIYMYLATDLVEGEACADEGEFISTYKIAINELLKMVMNKEITDAKTIIGILMAEKIIKGEIKI
ncbi:NUDIX hydrolase [Herbivorax sp. ANBcel31]|uniref:NUDIX domain-containing protein n=1 Tax=Herbivorax sp. ANBcel31 TaxID=3069754 RepID=UPI0027B59FFA|nr:NUDIX hydrolase [Herbivorax sp. ANBcel31]MDQ2086195.1 NUDIX hydrolase [Herbivorax sp. ANBcel31]